jgi:hypothetical protein
VGKKYYHNYVPNNQIVTAIVVEGSMISIETGGIIVGAKSAENGAFVYILIREKTRLLFMAVNMQNSTSAMGIIDLEKVFQYSLGAKYSGGAIVLKNEIPYADISGVVVREDYQGVSAAGNPIVKLRLSKNGQLSYDDETLNDVYYGEGAILGSFGEVAFGVQGGTPFILGSDDADFRTNKLPVYWQADNSHEYSSGTPVAIFAGSWLAGNLASNIVFFRSISSQITTVIVPFNSAGCNVEVFSANNNEAVFKYACPEAGKDLYYFFSL